MRTQDNTTLANPSQVRLPANDIDEDSILREVSAMNKNIRKLPAASMMASPKHLQKTTVDKDNDMGSADFEMSNSLSPGKLDPHLEKILNEQNKIGQE